MVERLVYQERREAVDVADVVEDPRRADQVDAVEVGRAAAASSRLPADDSMQARIRARGFLGIGVSQPLALQRLSRWVATVSSGVASNAALSKRSSV